MLPYARPLDITWRTGNVVDADRCVQRCFVDWTDHEGGTGVASRSLTRPSRRAFARPSSVAPSLPTTHAISAQQRVALAEPRLSKCGAPRLRRWTSSVSLVGFSISSRAIRRGFLLTNRGVCASRTHCEPVSRADDVNRYIRLTFNNNIASAIFSGYSHHLRRSDARAIVIINRADVLAEYEYFATVVL